MKFLKLIRFKNLIMLALMLLVLHFFFLKYQNIPIALNDFQFCLLIIGTMCIAGAGYIINNIIDIETDLINKPKNVIVGTFISETTAYNYYMILNVIGVGIGFYLSNSIEKPSLTSIPIVIAITLYFYSTNLKQTLLIGNFITALLTSLPIIIVGLFDLYPIVNANNQSLLGLIFQLLLDYALISFILNFIREIIKDIEDVKGDRNMLMRTLPIVFGVEKTTKLVFVLSIIPSVLVFFYVYKYYFLNGLYWITVYSIVFIIAPLLLFSVKTWLAKTQEDFKFLSTILKLIMLFGVLSIAVTVLNLKYNV